MNVDRETDIVTRFLKSINITMDSPPPIPQEKFNAAILAPICIVDVAYGLYQKVFKYPYEKERKKTINEIKRLFSEKVYATKGLFYKGLTQDDVLYLSDYSDEQAERLQPALADMYSILQNAAKDAIQNDEARDIYCNIFIANVLLQISITMMKDKWRCESHNLNRLLNRGIELSELWRKKWVKNNEKIDVDKELLVRIYLFIDNCLTNY